MSSGNGTINYLKDKRKGERIDGAFQIILSVIQNVTPDAHEALDTLAKASAQCLVYVEGDPDDFMEAVRQYVTIIQKLKNEAEGKAPLLVPEA